MPCAFSHCINVAETLKLLPEGAARVIMSAPEAYYLGAQGPDPYMFLLLSASKKRRSNGLSHAFHDADAKELFAIMLRTAFLDPLRQSFLYGFLTHYGLDSTAHPYVTARACRRDHVRLETAVDMAMLEYTGSQPEDERPWELICADKEVLTRIDAYMCETVKALTGRETVGYYKAAVKRTRFVMRLMFDPKHKMEQLLLRLDMPEAADTLFGHAHYDVTDPLNLTHQEWRSLWTDEPFVASFPELMSEAHMRSSSIIEAAHAALQGEADMRKTAEKIGSRDFMTGTAIRYAGESAAVCCFEDTCGQKRHSRLHLFD